MRIASLRMINFRNYAYQDLDLHPGINLFYGANAQGKTNLLEAVYYSARGRSFKNSPDKSLIRFGQRSAYIRARILLDPPSQSPPKEKRVEVKLSRVDRKRVRINEVEIENHRELSQQFPVVLFAPQDLNLIEGGPEERRNFLDDLLKELDPLYGAEWAAYRRVLGQRNHLLKNARNAWFDRQLQVLDQQLVQAALPLVQKRGALIQELSPRLAQIHDQLSDGHEPLSVVYQPSGSPDPETMRALLAEAHDRDLELRTSTLGPHKDECEVLLEGLPARRFASRGQTRTLTLTLKLAEFQMLKEKKGRQPILLLDDVFSELDGQRADYLLQAISGFQALMTTNELAGIHLPPGTGSRYRVQAGQAEEVE